MNFANLGEIKDVDVAGKRVIVRADLNVPIRDGLVGDATRIVRIAPCLLDLAARNAKVVVLSHFGRPKGKALDEFSMRPVAERLADILQRPVRFVDDCVGAEANRAVAEMSDGDVVLMENLRFHPGEEANDPEFAKQLVAYGDVFVGEAFSSAHRAHASTEAITHLLPSYAGPLMMEEIRALRAALEEPKRPTVAVVGGAKVSTKIPVLTNLMNKVDKLIIGGGMANTFLLANGVNVGQSLAEPDLGETARKIMDEAASKSCEIFLPIDVVVAEEFKPDAASSTVAVGSVPADAMILDVGPRTVAHLAEVLANSNTLLWNGPLGAFEIAPFGEGTFALAREAAKLTEAGSLTSIAGGGDTVAALNAADATKSFSYVSTAGGAFLEWLEGRELPGVAALMRPKP